MKSDPEPRHYSHCSLIEMPLPLYRRLHLAPIHFAHSRNPSATNQPSLVNLETHHYPCQTTMLLDSSTLPARPS